MKEYLDTEKGYVLVKDTCKRSEDWIEVPEGAECLTVCEDEDKNKWYLFWRGDCKFCVGYDNDWYDLGDVLSMAEYLDVWDGSARIVWQRPQQPESLPFVDDEVQSINDQYAEIEQVRQHGLKLDNGKPRHSLLPKGSISSIIAVLEFGAKKYEANNWQKVDNAKERYYDAAMRHIDSWWNGEKFDQETGIHHLAHAVTNLFFLKWFDDKENNNG